MSLSDAYLVTTKNLISLINSIHSAQAPERFNNKFLESLDFTSSNDRLYIKLFKELGFVDDGGVPTQRYYDFLDQSQAKTIMAMAIKDAYGDLFAVRKDAWKMTTDEVKNKFKTLTQGKKSDHVLGLMANTFKALADYADWETPLVSPLIASEELSTSPTSLSEPPQKTETLTAQNSSDQILNTSREGTRLGQLHYNIQIHLPDSRDPAVFDAIFQGLKKHLL